MNTTYRIVAILIIIFASCNSIKKIDNAKQTEYHKIAVKKYGKDVKYMKSPKKSYVICQKVIDINSLNPNELTRFFVYDIKNRKNIYEDAISGAQLSWNSDFEIRIEKQKGIINSTEDTGKNVYIYNLKTKNITY